MSGIASAIASVSLASCASGTALSSTEQAFIERVKSERAAMPGSVYAQEYPEAVTEHLSWKWPDNQTLVDQGNAICEQQRKYPGLLAINSTSLEFLNYYSINQKSALASAAYGTFCPEFGVDNIWGSP